MRIQRSPYFERHLYRSHLNSKGAIVCTVSIYSLIILIGILFFDDISISSPNYLMGTVAVPHIKNAARMVRKEKSQLADEKNAFENFIKNVVALEPAEQASLTSSASSTQALCSLKRSSTSRSIEEYSLHTVREAYRETVMDVPHYQKEYDESIERNMRTELGPEIAQAVTDDGPLFQQLLDELVKQSREARRERSILLQSLERELDSITDSKRTIEGVQQKTRSIKSSLYPADVSQIVHGWNRLDPLEEQMTAHIRQRQSEIHSGWNSMPPHALQRYLYSSHLWTYPILIDALKTVEQINRVRDQVVQHLYRW
jgi:uncharacterized protein YmfQ (DUF2313 family)